MKKYLIVAFLLLSCVFVLAACGERTDNNNLSSNEADNSLKIVTTIFPTYDWLRQIVGDLDSQVEITLLVANGLDLHSYQPAVEDIRKLSECDLIVYVGGESEEWVETALQEAVNPDMQALNLLSVLGDAAMAEQTEQASAEPEYDEHVWLSLNNAALFCNTIAEKLADIDPDNAEVYLTNAAAYQKKLALLDDDYKSAVASAPQKTLLFADRFPFLYLTEDYGLNWYAAFAGCSAETEASFATVQFLAEKIDELGLHNVLVIEKSDQRLAQTIVQNTQGKDQQILVMDSMQAVTSKDIDEGANYLTIMEKNLAVLREALK